MLATLFSGAVAVGGVLLLGPLMPDHYTQLEFERIEEIVNAGRRFKDKAVELTCLAIPAAGAADAEFAEFEATSPDREQKLAIRAKIPRKLLDELGKDSPLAPEAKREWKYVVKGKLAGGKGELKLKDVEFICRRSKMKQK